MIYKLNNKLKKLANIFLLAPDEKRFIKFANQRWGTFKSDRVNAEILLDIIDFKPFIFQLAYCSNFVAAEQAMKIKTVDTSFDSKMPQLRNLIFKYSRLRKIYGAFGCEDGLNYNSLSKEELEKLEYEANILFSDLRTKYDLVELEYRNLKIGDLIYDTYLRVYNAETVVITDLKLLNLIKWALIVFFSVNKYLENHPVKKVILSHSVYIQYGILARLAVKKDIPVYMFSKWNTQIVHKLDKLHFLHTNDHSKYKDKFEKIQNKQDCLAMAKSQLKLRLSGAIDEGISYVKQSAYKKNSRSATRVMKNNGRTRVVIFLHCFYDSPHIYSSMLFADFYEWLNYTLEVLKKTDFDVYVKPHPGGLKGNDRVIAEFKRRFPLVSFIDKNILNTQLIEEGINAAVTVYGTIGHELPYNGVPVITAGDNPHSAFNFCNNAKTLDEYTYFLLNADKLNNDISKTEIEQFFYMHYLRAGDGRINGLNDIFNIGQLKNNKDALDLLLNREKQGDFETVDLRLKEAMSQVDKSKHGE